MHPIKTAFTELVGVTTPIVSAPMGYAWSAELAYAVATTGGFGMVGAALDTPEQIRTSLQTLRKRFSLPPNSPLPIGVGLIGWLLDKTELTEDPRIPAVLEEKPNAIWFAFGDDLGKYVRQVRAHDATREHKTLVFVCVNTVEEARMAIQDWQVDVLVAQGIEAGGHGSSHAPPTSLLVTSILTAIPNPPPILAAGGIHTGAQVASLLTLGASGVVLGTRLLFTPECGYTPIQKSLLIESSTSTHATTRGMCYDEVNRTLGWPSGIDGRAIANDIWTDYVEGVSVEERLRRFDEGKVKGEKERVVVWAGAGLGLTREVKGAAEVVKEVHEEAIARIQWAQSLLGL
ncbi:2-nitropropane dioxygenase [Irpex rosettiformis]|uniref:2-nitropropane dioxygenase n=1 Tax=Irpex rosettiformis TaxID=378272 RepID=A0ACB8TRT2_9APHY|nr:2-nitropropane dioxygenase [Irpex rosettiformis]